MQLPTDLLHIPLRYAGRCQSCSKKLDQGIRAHWSPSSRKVWCEACRAKLSAKAKPGAVKRPTAPPNERIPEINTKQSEPVVVRTPWQQLCDYALSCVESEAANSLIDYEQLNKRWFAHGGAEQLIVGHADSIIAPAGLDEKLGKGKKSVVYGWPTVIVKGRDNKAKVAPLFAVQIEPEQKEGNSVVLHAVMEPEFNLAVAASGAFDPSAVQEIKELMLDGLPFGDAIAFENLSREIAAILGLRTCSKPDAGSLATGFGREPGIHNAAISVLTEWSGYTATLREELAVLRSRPDWQDTAAARLLSVSGNTNRTMEGPLAAPLPSNQSQEEVLNKIGNESLTVVTGPPGTGKTQLVVNAVANVWIDGEKVLLTSTNNGAVDVAVRRAAKEVGVGLLMRTGNRKEREEVPNRITLAVAEAKKHTGDQASARARLRRAVNARNDLLKKLQPAGPNLMSCCCGLRRIAKNLKRKRRKRRSSFGGTPARRNFDWNTLR